MSNAASSFRKFAGIAGTLAALAVWPGIGQAQLSGILPPLPLPPLPGGGSSPTQTVTGQASGVTAVVAGNVVTLASSGTAVSPEEPVGTGQVTGSIPGLLSAEALHAASMAWTDQVASQASLGNLAMTVGGTGVSATWIQSNALAVAGSAASGASSVEGLTIGGIPVSASGAPNQVISLLGLTVTLNEQIQSAGGIVVNALRVRTLDGLTDVVLGSAQAGI